MWVAAMVQAWKRTGWLIHAWALRGNRYLKLSIVGPVQQQPAGGFKPCQREKLWFDPFPDPFPHFPLRQGRKTQNFAAKGLIPPGSAPPVFVSTFLESSFIQWLRKQPLTITCRMVIQERFRTPPQPPQRWALALKPPS